MHASVYENRVSTRGGIQVWESVGLEHCNPHGIWSRLRFFYSGLRQEGALGSGGRETFLSPSDELCHLSKKTLEQFHSLVNLFFFTTGKNKNMKN